MYVRECVCVRACVRACVCMCVVTIVFILFRIYKRDQSLFLLLYIITAVKKQTQYESVWSSSKALGW